MFKRINWRIKTDQYLKRSTINKATKLIEILKQDVIYYLFY